MGCLFSLAMVSPPIRCGMPYTCVCPEQTQWVPEQAHLYFDFSQRSSQQALGPVSMPPTTRTASFRLMGFFLCSVIVLDRGANLRLGGRAGSADVSVVRAGARAGGVAAQAVAIWTGTRLAVVRAAAVVFAADDLRGRLPADGPSVFLGHRLSSDSIVSQRHAPFADMGQRLATVHTATIGLAPDASQVERHAIHNNDTTYGRFLTQ